jgi:hypothetical protein
MAILAAFAADPMEFWVRIREMHAAQREAPAPNNLYSPDPDWESRLQSLTDIPSSGASVRAFYALWVDVMTELQVQGIQPGPESFKAWNDGDAGFVRAIWCLVNHLKPINVVETGVAHGVTSRFILEALDRNGKGHLWSIDRPPLDPSWREHIGIAVRGAHRGALRDRWSYIAGSSQRRLPKLLDQLGHIDLFIHDSLHTERNVRFELEYAWASLRPGGALVVDDIDVNRGFHQFVQSLSGHAWLICEAEPVRPDLRRLNGKGMFGIALKNQP